MLDHSCTLLALGEIYIWLPMVYQWPALSILEDELYASLWYVCNLDMDFDRLGSASSMHMKPDWCLDYHNKLPK